MAQSSSGTKITAGSQLTRASRLSGEEKEREMELLVGKRRVAVGGFVGVRLPHGWGLGSSHWSRYESLLTRPQEVRTPLNPRGLAPEISGSFTGISVGSGGYWWLEAAEAA